MVKTTSHIRQAERYLYAVLRSLVFSRRNHRAGLAVSESMMAGSNIESVRRPGVYFGSKQPRQSGLRQMECARSRKPSPTNGGEG